MYVADFASVSGLFIGPSTYSRRLRGVLPESRFFFGGGKRGCRERISARICRFHAFLDEGARATRALVACSGSRFSLRDSSRRSASKAPTYTVRFSVSEETLAGLAGFLYFDKKDTQ
jgi:hypothetical protein